MEWEPDSSSKCCVICAKPFGRLTNRRHHCRNCGRLVCESCSTQRLVLAQIDPNDESYRDSSMSQKDNLARQYTNTPQRVCDACYKTITRKEQIRIQTDQRKEQENLILSMSSHVGISMIFNIFRIFFSF